MSIGITHKVSLTRYLQIRIFDDMKEKEKIRVINLNCKIAEFVDYIFNNKFDSFLLLREYCFNLSKIL